MPSVQVIRCEGDNDGEGGVIAWVHYEHQHMLHPPASAPSNNLRTTTPRPTTFGVEAWTGNGHITV